MFYMKFKMFWWIICEREQEENRTRQIFHFSDGVIMHAVPQVFWLFGDLSGIFFLSVKQHETIFIIVNNTAIQTQTHKFNHQENTLGVVCWDGFWRGKKRHIHFKREKVPLVDNIYHRPSAQESTCRILFQPVRKKSEMNLHFSYDA